MLNYVLSALYSACSLIWSWRYMRPLERMVRSFRYRHGLTLLFVLATSVWIVFLVYAESASDENTAISDIAALFLILVLPLFLAYFFLTTPWRTATYISSHDAQPAEIADRCKKLLEQHSFRVKKTKSKWISAVRDTKSDFYINPRAAPIELFVTFSVVKNTTTLSSRCTLNRVLFSDFDLDQVIANTSKGVAELDSTTLDAADKAIQELPLQRGGIESRISVVVTTCVMLGAAALLSLSFVIGWRAFEFQLVNSMQDAVLAPHIATIKAIEAPIKVAAEKLLSELKEDPTSIVSPENQLKSMKLSGFEGQIVVAIKEANGAIRLVSPEVHGSLLSTITKEIQNKTYTRYNKVGDHVLRLVGGGRIAHPKLEARFGLKQGQLMVGALFSYADLERLVENVFYPEGETLTYYSAGRSVVEFRSIMRDRSTVAVSEGKHLIPEDVIVSEMSRRQSDMNNFWRTRTAIYDSEYWRGLLFGWQESLRIEEHNGATYRVDYNIYEPGGVGTGWAGMSFARSIESFGERYWQQLLSSAIWLMLTLFVCVLLASLWVANLLSRRITSPVLDIRNSLRAVASGDYTVRTETTRTDEIGQLQRLVNYTAVELRKRESIKDLFGKYLSKQVADKILGGEIDGMVTGHRTEASILFADVRGFTTYAEQHEPETVTKSLNEYFEVMVDVIAAHEGVLDKYIGDGLMVVFGAPVPQPDHPKRAIITALEMQAALQSMNLKRAQRGDDPISIGIGVNTGMVISGNLGSVKRMEFTVIGDAVNLAARLESRAAKGQILIGKATYEAVKDQIESEPLGPISVKGKVEPVEIWWLKGLKPQSR